MKPRPATYRRPGKQVAFDHAKLGMKIREIMTQVVAAVPPDATVQSAARLMLERDVGMVPVCEGARVVGVLTDRDITVRAVACGRSTRKTLVRDLMTPMVVFCYDDEDVADAVASMEERQIRRVLVLNRKKQLVGVLSIGDLALDTGDRTLAGELLQRVSEPEPLGGGVSREA
jgi:CBS domain-containing protein